MYTTTVGDGPGTMAGDSHITTGLMVGTTLIILGDGTTHGDITVGDGPDTMAGVTLIMDGDMLATMDGADTTAVGTDPTITTTGTMAEITPTCPEEEDMPEITVLVWHPEVIEIPMPTELTAVAPTIQWRAVTWPIEVPEAIIAIHLFVDRSTRMPWPGTKPTEPLELHAAIQVIMAAAEPTVPMEPFLQQEAVAPITGVVRQPEVIHRLAITQVGAPEATSPRAMQHQGPVTLAGLQAHQEVQELTAAAEALPEVQVVLEVRAGAVQEALVV